MIKFIIGITLIALLIQYPSIMLLSGCVILCIYIYRKRPDLLEKIGFSIPPAENSKDGENNSLDEDPGFVTTEQKLEKIYADLEKNSNKDIENDPVFKENQRIIQETIRQNGIQSRLEKQVELLEEANRAAEQGRWSEVERIKRYLADLQATQL